ncbi:tetratricopeptide repeat protein [Candidatus Similichlamydia epinepheli]|uniref:tetratricopeptide repeat protein n=1 Tax=Candidatus Similichlamydia epinepheli TaxID=1903953 RepID=UPI001300B091|nr:SAM-dependent methyltransferase [Candidatus Similichlamydia epinepheli]
MGPKAWTHEGVPCYLTTSPFILSRYAHLFELQLKFWLSQGSLNPDDTIYILDLGCGVGRCGYLLLNMMQDLFESFPVRLKYVFVDLSDDNLQFILDHPDLRIFFDKGIADLACFDATCDEKLTLRLSQEILEADRLTNPVLAIANYFFDSLPHDLFLSDEGKLYEMHGDLVTPEGIETLPRAMRSAQLSVHRGEEINPENYYSQPSWNYALKRSHDVKWKNDFNFPIGAFRTLDLISSWSPAGYCLLASDQGSAVPHVLDQVGGHCMSSPAMGSVSVNYLSLHYYFHATQQDASITKSSDQSILVTAMATDRSSGNCLFPLFSTLFDSFGMVQYWQIVNCFQESGNQSIDFIEHLIRLGNYDPSVFFSCFESIRSGIASMPIEKRASWIECLVQVAKAFFPITTRDYPLLGDIGVLLFDLGAFQEALEVLLRVLALDGGQEQTEYNIKVCLKAMDREEEFEKIRQQVSSDLARSISSPCSHELFE